MLATLTFTNLHPFTKITKYARCSRATARRDIFAGKLSVKQKSPVCFEISFVALYLPDGKASLQFRRRRPSQLVVARGINGWSRRDQTFHGNEGSAKSFQPSPVNSEATPVLFHQCALCKTTRPRTSVGFAANENETKPEKQRGREKEREVEL